MKGFSVGNNMLPKGVIQIILKPYAKQFYPDDKRVKKFKKCKKCCEESK